MKKQNLNLQLKKISISNLSIITGGNDQQKSEVGEELCGTFLACPPSKQDCDKQ